MASLTQRRTVQAKAFFSRVRYERAFRYLPIYPAASTFNPSQKSLSEDYANHNNNVPGFSVSGVVFLSPFSLSPSLSSWLVFHPTSFDSEANSS